MIYAYENLVPGRNIIVPGFGLVEVEYVFTSYNRKVFCAKTLNGTNTQYVFKSFPFTDLPEKEAAEAARWAQLNINTYRGKLMKAGVPVVTEIGFTSISRDQTLILIQFENWAGQNIAEATSDFKKELVLNIVRVSLDQIIKPLFLNSYLLDKPERLELGIDFIPRNVVFRKEEEIYLTTYIDLFPPKFRFPCGQWGLEYPEPNNRDVKALGLFRSYNMVGILVNFWAHLVSLRPEFAEDFYLEIERFIRESGFNEKFDLEEKINEYILNYDLSAGKKSAEEIQKIISRWGFKEIFKYRLFGCAVAFCRPEACKYLSQLFEISHFQDSPLSSERVKEIKDLLVKMTNFPLA